MPQLTAAEIASLAGGTIRGDAAATVQGFVDHDRAVRPGLGFVATPTGHRYVAAAFAAGATLALVEHDDALPHGATGVVVERVRDALATLATWWRLRLRVRVVAVTGSTGKTLTRDLFAAAARVRFRVHVSPKNYNNEYGVPLTVLSCPDDAQVLVVELGARHVGEIGELARIVRPDIAVVTGVGVAHLGEFGSREAIARTKGELLAELSGGAAILPSGDDFLALLSGLTSGRVVTVGPGGYVRPAAIEVGDDGCSQVELAIGQGERIAFRMPVPGRALVRNAAMAIAAARELGVAPGDAAASWTKHTPLSGRRMQVMRLGSRTLVDDVYNANPTSMRAALRGATEIARGRPVWGMLGHMAEIGTITDSEHLRIGRLAAALGFERVVAIGVAAAGIARGAGRVGMRADDIDAAVAAATESPSDAVVLVKGSRAAGLERLVDRLQSTWGSRVEVA